MTIVAGAADALLRLRKRDFRLIVVTNQPDVARGTQPRAVVEAMNEKLRAALPVDEIVVCWHDGDACDCRKPKPGALLDAARRHGIDLANSFMVGDRWRDIEAGQRAGVRCLFIDHGYTERQPEGEFVRVESIVGAAEEILRMTRPSVEQLKVKIFADGADRAGMLEMYARPYIKGFTTNPTLMHKAGLTDYRAFARSILEAIPDRPISFEVFSDELAEMERQAREIATWGENVYVKVPITNTRRDSAVELVRRLSNDGVKVNVTAMMTLEQVRDICAAVKDGAPSNVSVFAGRIADTGRDPLPLMAEAVEILRELDALS
jgi:transaldolase